LISTHFFGEDWAGPTTTDVHVLYNSVSIFDGVVDTFWEGPSFDVNLSVAAGDTIDFAVGFGDDGTYNNDSTGLRAVIIYSGP
jgi:hypothetical protein